MSRYACKEIKEKDIPTSANGYPDCEAMGLKRFWIEVGSDYLQQTFSIAGELSVGNATGRKLCDCDSCTITCYCGGSTTTTPSSEFKSESEPNDLLPLFLVLGVMCFCLLLLVAMRRWKKKALLMNEEKSFSLGANPRYLGSRPRRQGQQRRRE